MEETVKTEKLSTHLNTVREKYKKQRASLIKDLEADEIGKFMMADKITFSSILAEKLREDPGFISSEVIWPEILKALSYMIEVNKIQQSE
jgi:hypothetical protein